MSAVMALMAQEADAERYLAKKLESAAFELTRQSIRVKAGDPYEGRKVAQRLAAVTEAHEILDAYRESLDRLIRGVA